MTMHLTKLFFLGLLSLTNAEIPPEALDPQTEDDLRALGVSAADEALAIMGPEYEAELEVIGSGRNLQIKGENELCGPFLGTCSEGLSCVPVAVGQRCKPVNCFEQAIMRLEETWNRTEWTNSVLMAAGFGSEQHFLDAMGPYNLPAVVPNSGPITRLKQAVSENPPPHAQLQGFVDDCRSEYGILPDARQTTAGSTTTLGFLFQCGALANFLVSFMSATGTTDENSAVLLRFCGGLGPVGGVGFMFAYGFYGTGTFVDLVGCVTILTSVGGSAVLGAQVGSVCVLQSPNAINGIEVAAGVGVGAGLGVNFCGALRN